MTSRKCYHRDWFIL